MSIKISSFSTSILRDRWLNIILLFWALPVFLKLGGIDESILILAVLLSAFLTMAISLIKPRYALINLPFLALLSPMAGYLSILGNNILLSDLVFLIIVVQMIWMIASGKLKITKSLSNRALALFILLFIFSSILGVLFGTLISLKPLLYLFELAIIYIYSKLYLSDPRHREFIIYSWVIATIFGSLLVIHAYVNNEFLVIAEPGVESQAVLKYQFTTLYQAKHYYDNFHFAMGITIVILITSYLLSNGKNRLLLLVLGLPVPLIGLLIVMNKTAIFGMILSLILIYSIISIKKMSDLPKLLAFYISSSLILFLLVNYLVFALLGEYQADYWINKLTASSSLFTRFDIYRQALVAWFEYPLQILFGMGPDFLDGSGNHSIVTTFKTSKITRLAQGTVDSGWISYLIELGVIGFTLLLIVIRRSVKELIPTVKRMKNQLYYSKAAILSLAGLSFTLIALSTQMLGYSKISWLPWQLIVIGLLDQQTRVSSITEIGK